MNSDVMLNRKLNWLRDNYAQKLLTACSPRKVAANLASLATLYALILICTLTLNPNANAVTCTANTSPLASCTDLTVNQSNLSLVISSGVTINTTSIFSSIFFDGRNGALTGNSLLNNGTLTESNFESSLVLNNSTLNQFINTGSVLGRQIAISLARNSVINTFTNQSTGVISSTADNNDAILLQFGSAIESLVNNGTIRGGGLRAGIWFDGANGSDRITTLVNSGTLAGGYYGIRGQGTSSIGTVTNTGSITGNAASIYFTNTSTLGTLNNLQGAGNVNGALTYIGNLPNRYNVIINSVSTYGKLSISVPSGQLTFGVHDTSILTASTYRSVITGLTSAGILSSSLTGTYGSYSWSLNNVSGANWDLVVTCASSCSSNNGSSNNGNSISNQSSIISRNGSFRLGGLAGNPVVFDGGTLVLASGDRSSQAFSVTSSNGVISTASGGSSTLSGSFSGAGGLTVNGGGTLVMSGINSYQGDTTVSSNTTLSVSGSSPTGEGTLTIDNGSTLMGSGFLSSPVMVSGIIKPGNSPGYLRMPSLTLNNGSTFQQDISGVAQATASTPTGSAGYYSFTQTDGIATINSGSILKPMLQNLFASDESGYGSAPYVPRLGDQFRILTATGGITGRFSSLTQPDGLSARTQFAMFTNMNNSNSIDLAVVPSSYKSTISSASGNKNAQSVGSALDQITAANVTGTSTSIQDRLLYSISSQTSESGIASYAQSLAGEVYAAAVATIAQTTQRVQQAVMTRLGDTMGLGLPNSLTTGNSDLMAKTNTVLSGGVAPATVSSNPNAEAQSFVNDKTWGEVAYQKGNRASDNNSGGWNSNLYQLVFGSDWVKANGMTLGGGFALSSTTLNPTYGSGTIQQGSIFAYGKMPVQEYVVDAMASIGLNSSDLSRGDISNLSNGFRNKNILGNDALISLGVSRPIDIDQVRVTPYARVIWQMVTQSGVNEGDVASGLSVKSFTGNGVRGVLGVAAGSKETNPMTEKYTYRAYVGVGADSSGLLNPTLNASLAGFGTNITTPNAGATFVQAGLYGTAKIADNAYAYAGLSGEARSGQTLGAVNVGVRIQF